MAVKLAKNKSTHQSVCLFVQIWLEILARTALTLLIAAIAALSFSVCTKNMIIDIKRPTTIGH